MKKIFFLISFLFLTTQLYSSEIFNNLPAGVYFCTLIAGNNVETSKFIVIK